MLAEITANRIRLGKMFSERIERALAMATIRHQGQFRRCEPTPYVSHPCHVALILARLQASEDAIIVALLHDLIEDTTHSPPDADQLLNQMDTQFGPSVKEAVAALEDPLVFRLILVVRADDFSHSFNCC